MHELSLQSERRTQLIDITDRVREAVAGESGTAVLVYVPHTTAAITINEKIDPVLVEDLERAFERVVGDDWGWRHDDVDGPNGAARTGGRRWRERRCSSRFATARSRSAATRRSSCASSTGRRPRSVYVTVLQ